ncbi:NAD(P)H-dependent oxidoreductase [Treponema brennaborense]|uniref:NAD(P)H dehydrogenase (Quinone) n=1 Tax=Treponema brennaborense (strain DSM 12168 / CIP 105900 / DD5/3) TaxID=906968 RepID=F4LJV9_TREBD|nr:NAD(P)H-dependent oxidoreductase [Treponema brennaborense]AEE16439.1 NAD(P)H dehydrogenase (quinone) [Treponema brennaborense DSM 12168]
MNVFIVFAHPCGAAGDSFTARLLHAFIRGLERAGHTYEVSDLYAMNFTTDMSAAEYEREAYYVSDAPIPDDVRAEQEKILKADALAFIYPVFWTEAPAKLVGWFDRVWTFGFAYEPCVMPRFRKALCLACAGHTAEELEKSGMAQAMRSVMLTDRISTRAGIAELHLFGGMSRGQQTRESFAAGHLAEAERLGFAL